MEKNNRHTNGVGGKRVGNLGVVALPVPVHDNIDRDSTRVYRHRLAQDNLIRADMTQWVRATADMSQQQNLGAIGV